VTRRKSHIKSKKFTTKRKKSTRRKKRLTKSPNNQRSNLPKKMMDGSQSVEVRIKREDDSSLELQQK